MSFSNIFVGDNYKNKASNIIINNFDIDTYCIETMILLEEEFFKITSDNMYARYVATNENNIEILIEGFGDFKDAVVKYFKKFIQMIGDLIKNITVYISSFIGEFDRFLNKHKNHILKSEPNFTINGYKYTNKFDIPDMSILTDFVSEFNSKVNRLNDITVEDIVKEKEHFDQEFSLIRAKIIDEQDVINDNETLRQVLKRKLRDDNETQIEITVDKAYLSKIVLEYSESKKYLLKTKSEYEKLLSIMTNMKSFFERSVGVYFEKEKKYIKTNEIKVDNRFQKGDTVKYDYSLDKLRIYNKFFEIYFYECRKLSNLYVIVLQEKIASLKEELAQYRSVIRKCIFTKKSN